jgi:hypothetical protein
MSNDRLYPDDVRLAIARKYSLALSRLDKRLLAEMYAIESEAKLYNLASRLKATRPHASTVARWTEAEIPQVEEYDPRTDVTRLLIRVDPESHTWTSEHDRYITERWAADEGKTRRLSIEEIAFFLDLSETAVAYRARILGLRNIPKYYDVSKVALWLGVTIGSLFKHGPSMGLDLYACTDRHGKMRRHPNGEGGIVLVSTISLARFLVEDHRHMKLIDRGADKFFIRDILESVRELRTGEACWEPNIWVSHGHTCLCPWSAASFRAFFNGYDTDMEGIGVTMHPRDLSPSRQVGSDVWKRENSRNIDAQDEELELPEDVAMVAV